MPIENAQYFLCTVPGRHKTQVISRRKRWSPYPTRKTIDQIRWCEACGTVFIERLHETIKGIEAVDCKVYQPASAPRRPRFFKGLQKK